MLTKKIVEDKNVEKNIEDGRVVARQDRIQENCNYDLLHFKTL